MGAQKGKKQGWHLFIQGAPRAPDLNFTRELMEAVKAWLGKDLTRSARALVAHDE